MWAHSHVIWSRATGYSQLIWSQNSDVFGPGDLCSRAATLRIAAGQHVRGIDGQELASCRYRFPLVLDVLNNCPVLERERLIRYSAKNCSSEGILNPDLTGGNHCWPRNPKDTMIKFPAPEEFSPKQFELFVRDTLDSQGADLQDYVSNHQETIITPDGEYAFDVTVRFSAMGVSYLTLIECKRYKNPVKRERVELLWSRVQSASAHKGILFSTSGFQSGAIKYAKSKNIGLVTVADGRSTYQVRAEDPELIPWDRMPDGIPRVVGWVIDENRLACISDSDGCRLRDLMPD